jgi:Flp pilus assembly protein TadB
VTIEDQLQRALRRREPPAAFATRVARAVSDRPPDQSGRRWSGPKHRRAALGLAASLLLGAAGVIDTVRQQRARHAEESRQQVEHALQIVSRTLQDVRVKVATATMIGDNHEPRESH